jgi:hypothetical protein
VKPPSLEPVHGTHQAKRECAVQGAAGQAISLVFLETRGAPRRFAVPQLSIPTPAGWQVGLET